MEFYFYRDIVAYHTDLPETDLGQGVVLGLLDKGNIDTSPVVTFDNLFTSLPLLDKLTGKVTGKKGKRSL